MNVQESLLKDSALRCNVFLDPGPRLLGDKSKRVLIHSVPFLPHWGLDITVTRGQRLLRPLLSPSSCGGGGTFYGPFAYLHTKSWFMTLHSNWTNILLENVWPLNSSVFVHWLKRHWFLCLPLPLLPSSDPHFCHKVNKLKKLHFASPMCI